MKWLQTRKRELQEEIQKTLDEVVKEKLFTVALLIRCSEHSTKFPEKCPCKLPKTKAYLELGRTSKMGFLRK